MPQLDPTWFVSQLFWLVATFLILHELLSRVILPPLRGVVAKRADTVANDIATADSLRAQAERAKHDYEHTLAQSREMAHGLINEVLEESKKHSEKTLRALDVEIHNKLEDAEARINAKKHELVNNLTPMAAEFAGMIAELLTKQPATPDQASRVVMDVIKAGKAA